MRLSAGQTILVSSFPWLIKAEELPEQQVLCVSHLQLSNHNPCFARSFHAAWCKSAPCHRGHTEGIWEWQLSHQRKGSIINHFSNPGIQYLSKILMTPYCQLLIYQRYFNKKNFTELKPWRDSKSVKLGENKLTDFTEETETSPQYLKCFYDSTLLTLSANSPQS